MPHRQLPNSVPTVIRLLTTARDQWKNTPNAADRAISADHWAQLDDANPNSFLNQFLGEASAVHLAEAAQSPLTDADAKAIAKLTQCISHFYQVFDRAVARGTFTAGERLYYGRDASATSLPDLSSYQAVFEAGDNVVKGEAARQTAEGAAYVPMALPSAAEVGALLTQCKAADAASGKAQKATGDKRGLVNADYPTAQKLAVDICDTVEFFYRNLTDDATRRVNCERWGVVYIFDDNTARAHPAHAAGHPANTDAADHLTRPPPLPAAPRRQRRR